jgi:hypothetical protein
MSVIIRIALSVLSSKELRATNNGDREESTHSIPMMPVEWWLSSSVGRRFKEVGGAILDFGVGRGRKILDHVQALKFYQSALNCHFCIACRLPILKCQCPNIEILNKLSTYHFSNRKDVIVVFFNQIGTDGGSDRPYNQSKHQGFRISDTS